MAEPQIPQPFFTGRVRPTPKEREKKYREVRERQISALMSAVTIATLPSGVEIQLIPSTVAGEAPSIGYKCPSKITRSTASERAAWRAARTATTAVTAGTTALAEGSVLNKDPGESSETLVENLKLEEIRISN